MNEYLPPSFFGNRAFFQEKNQRKKRGKDVAYKQADKIGITAAKFRQEQNARNQRRRADKIKGKGLLFKAHGIEHRVQNHRQAHGQ